MICNHNQLKESFDTASVVCANKILFFHSECPYSVLSGSFLAFETFPLWQSDKLAHIQQVLATGWEFSRFYLILKTTKSSCYEMCNDRLMTLVIRAVNFQGIVSMALKLFKNLIRYVFSNDSRRLFFTHFHFRWHSTFSILYKTLFLFTITKLLNP